MISLIAAFLLFVNDASMAWWIVWSLLAMANAMKAVFSR